MSDVMLSGVLKMSNEMAMSNELSRLQFYQRVLQLDARVEAQPVQPEQELVSHAVIAGALFDFMGYLTSLKKRIVLSASDDAAPAVDAIRDFAEKRGLSLNDAQVREWIDALAPTSTPCEVQPEQEPVATLLLQSKQTYERNFGPSAAADWIYSDLLELLDTTPPKRKPLTDEQVKELLRIGPVYAPDGVVTRTPFSYRKELLDTAVWALRKAEAAHGIKENT